MTTALKQTFLTPMGRLVQGHPMEKQDKNMQGQPLMTQGGQPTQRYFCALAFAKNDPQFPAFYQQLVTVARQSFPNLFDAAGNCTHPRFSWKLIDGDGVDDNGKSNKTKEGFAGCWVVKFQSSFPPRCFYKDRYAPQDQIQDANLIRRGYYGRVSGTIEGNGNPQKPGLYVNLGMFELSAQGIEITSGPDAASVFGGAAPAMPQGATPFDASPAQGMPAMPGMPATTYTAPPQMPAMPAMPGAQPAMPGLPQPGGLPGGAPSLPAMVAPQAPAPMMPVQPNPAFAAGPASMPQMPGMPQMPSPPPMPVAPPVAPAEPQRTAAWPAQFGYGQMIAAGWNDATLRQAGYIV